MVNAWVPASRVTATAAERGSASTISAPSDPSSPKTATVIAARASVRTGPRADPSRSSAGRRTDSRSTRSPGRMRSRTWASATGTAAATTPAGSPAARSRPRIRLPVTGSRAATGPVNRRPTSWAGSARAVTGRRSGGHRATRRSVRRSTWPAARPRAATTTGVDEAGAARARARARLVALSSARSRQQPTAHSRGSGPRRGSRRRSEANMPATLGGRSRSRRGRRRSVDDRPGCGSPTVEPSVGRAQAEAATLLEPAPEPVDGDEDEDEDDPEDESAEDESLEDEAPSPEDEDEDAAAAVFSGLPFPERL